MHGMIWLLKFVCIKSGHHHSPYDNALILRAWNCYSYITVVVKHSEKKNNFHSCPFFFILFCVWNRPLQKPWTSTGNTSLLEIPSPLQPLWWYRRNQWLYKMNSGVFAQQGVMLSGGGWIDSEFLQCLWWKTSAGIIYWVFYLKLYSF